MIHMSQPSNPISPDFPVSLLIIEDSEEDRHYYCRLLNQKAPSEFKILEVETGEESLSLCDQTKPDCILLDYRLPDMDGLELLRSLNDKFNNTVPILLLTGQGSEQIASQAIKEGASDYLVKGELNQNTFHRTILNAVQQKRQHLETERKLKRLVAFLDKNPNPIIEMNRERKITYQNAAAQRFFPELQELGERHPLLEDTSSLWEDLHSLENQFIVREFKQKESVFQAEFTIVPAHDLIGIYISDITERKRLEEVKARLVSTVSHELRTPLAIILGCLSNLTDEIAGAMNEDQTELVQIAQKNAERLSRLINNILDLSRLESGQNKIQKESLDIAVMLAEIEKSFIQLTQTKGIRLDLNIEPNLPQVSADADLVSRVFTNLLSNASRYAKELVQISVKLKPAPDKNSRIKRWAQISVSDDGPGIDSKKIHVIFDKFVQADRSKEGSGYKGTGLGLAISKEIIEQHGGQIWAESSPNQGSTFHFTLPVY